MTQQRPPHGAGPRPKGQGPAPIPDPETRQRHLRRVDRIYGVTLFVIGAIATIIMMRNSTETMLVTQVAQFYRDYGIEQYTRADGLAALEWAGIILHPLNYALWLYLALRRWRAEKTAAWLAVIGAAIAWVLSSALLAAAMFAHQPLVDAIVEQGLVSRS